ncbi:DUF4935 domain-containing protein [Stenotrophomonas sp. Br8]|uniref:PIN domain-containing protein n=1 Tax=Stenotrophomonas sp. Br8 TaxID=2759658 RepID=UPI00168A6209|nr:PIN domain-containing protein [Stenotrophomonas sp. Br8]MBD3682997.1 DUF4935 domain-containing protein [Stenotrophomonas sp. Br8]
MKSSFKGYYAPDAKEIKRLWEHGTFVFDTNVLLHLYRVPKSTREQVLSTLQELKERLWIPRHVGLEFQRRRLGAIHAAHQKTAAVLKEIDKSLASYFTAVEKAELKERGVTEADDSLSAIRAEANKVRSTVEATLAGQLSPTDHDSIRDSLDELFHQVGAAPTQEQVTAWDSLAEQRFALKRGPGFEDGTKAEGDEPQYYAQGVTYQSQYGDLYIWMQILEHVRENNIEDVVFVTRDAKEDWWRLAPGEGKNRARLAPLEMLVEEMIQAGVKNFWMYQLDTFLIDAERQLKVDVSDLTIKDASQVEQLDALPQHQLKRFVRPIAAAECVRALELMSCSILEQSPYLVTGCYKLPSGVAVGVLVFPVRLLIADNTIRLKQAIEVLNLLEGAETYEFYLLVRSAETANRPQRMREFRNLVLNAVPEGAQYQMQVIAFRDSAKSQLSLLKTLSIGG